MQNSVFEVVLLSLRYPAPWLTVYPEGPGVRVADLAPVGAVGDVLGAVRVATTVPSDGTTPTVDGAKSSGVVATGLHPPSENRAAVVTARPARSATWSRFRVASNATATGPPLTGTLAPGVNARPVHR
ncbi:hypothetical protein [Pseudonocardia alni]|uniref:Uncharacterized protein n=1 Tax=Pseudonocardia alni subsp. carboxydivorans TaxID=415010 RepID=A0ABU9AN43_PSEA5